MLNLKKTAVAVLAFSSSAVFAGTMGPVCAPGNVTVPCEATAWDFGAQALYLRAVRDANHGYQGYAANSVTGERTWNDRNPNWGWGFKIDGSYHFNTGNDLDINWYHMSKSTDLGLYDSSFTAAGAGSRTDLDLKPQWDAVNIEFGQHVDFSEAQKIRFHGGAQFARIKSNSSASIFNAAGTLFVNETESETYNGFGPRVGLDMSYNWGNGFAMYANGATALLIGTQKFSDSHGAYTALQTPVPAVIQNGSKTSMVPELEAKLGLMYTYALASGDLSLDIGYMWVNYFNAEHGAFPDLGRTTSTISQSNFALDGLYFGGKWVGNVA